MALTVTYCGVCGMPPDLCSFGPAYESCKPWLRANRPELIVDSAAPSAAAIGESATVGGGVGGGVSADGDDALAAPLAALALDGAGAAGGGTADAADSSAAPADEPKKKAKAPAAPRVTIEVAERARKKHVTTITGLEAYCPKLKDASSAIGKKFGTGATVGKSPSNPNIAVVDVQGDVTDGIADLLFALYKIPEKLLVFK